MIIYHYFNIPHDLGVPSVSFFGHSSNIDPIALEDALWLGVEHERHSQQPLDPFCVKT